MRKPTISEIKEATLKTAPYFFSRGAMRGFGQRMSSFQVYKSPKGNIYIMSNMYMGREGNHVIGFTFRQFLNNDLKLVSNVPSGRYDLGKILDYIERN